MLLGRIEKKLQEICREQEDEVEAVDATVAKTIMSIVEGVRKIDDKYFSKSGHGWFKMGTSSSKENNRLIVQCVEDVIFDGNKLMAVSAIYSVTAAAIQRRGGARNRCAKAFTLSVVEGARRNRKAVPGVHIIRGVSTTLI